MFWGKVMETSSPPAIHPSNVTLLLPPHILPHTIFPPPPNPVRPLLAEHCGAEKAPNKLKLDSFSFLFIFVPLKSTKHTDYSEAKFAICLHFREIRNANTTAPWPFFATAFMVFLSDELPFLFSWSL